MFNRKSVGVLIACCVGMFGCGSQNPHSRLPVSGAVSFDGAPLDQGLISFEPQPGAAAVVNATAIIAGGKYELPAEAGLTPGSYTVAISSQPPAPPLPTDPVKAMEEASKPAPSERLPAKYNANSELKATVTEAGPNKFDFDLKSAP